jgi:alpha-tubulin suppressor-like RCC1 family protein
VFRWRPFDAGGSRELSSMSTPPVRALSCGEAHCVAVTRDGRAISWATTAGGEGHKFGQLGRSAAAGAAEGEAALPEAVVATAQQFQQWGAVELPDHARGTFARAS